MEIHEILGRPSRKNLICPCKLGTLEKFAGVLPGAEPDFQPKYDATFIFVANDGARQNAGEFVPKSVHESTCFITGIVLRLTNLSIPHELVKASTLYHPKITNPEP